jgi:hypothetical protein
MPIITGPLPLSVHERARACSMRRRDLKHKQTTMTNRRTFLGVAGAVATAAALPAIAQGRNTPQATGTPAAASITTKDATSLYVKDWGKGRPVILTHVWSLYRAC